MWYPGLNFRVHVSAGNETPAPAYFLELGICDHHKPQIKVSDLLSDIGWERIKDGFLMAGRMVPDKTRTEIFFVDEEEKNRILIELKKSK